MEVKGKKEIKSLIRRLATYNSWRLGDKPFESRSDMYSPDDVDALFDEVIESLEAYSRLIVQLTEFPPNFKIVSPNDVKPCACNSVGQKVQVADKRGEGALAVSSPNKDTFIQS